MGARAGIPPRGAVFSHECGRSQDLEPPAGESVWQAQVAVDVEIKEYDGHSKQRD
jgi:hypothetical protein